MHTPRRVPNRSGRQALWNCEVPRKPATPRACSDENAATPHPARRPYPRLHADELLTADRNFYSFTDWGLAVAASAQLLWRAPTGLALPVVAVLDDGSYLSLLINPANRNPARRKAILETARNGGEIAAQDGHLVRVIEYDVPDREGNDTGELIVLLSTITQVEAAGADELAAAYHERWKQETGHDQLKTHLRGPGRILRSRLPDLVHQEIWAWLIVHYAIAVLISRAAEAADIDPDRVSFVRTLRIIRRTVTGTADLPLTTGRRAPQNPHRDHPQNQPRTPTPHLPPRRQTSPPQQMPRQETRPASTRHHGRPTIHLHTMTPRAA